MIKKYNLYHYLIELIEICSNGGHTKTRRWQDFLNEKKIVQLNANAQKCNYIKVAVNIIQDVKTMYFAP